MQMRILEFLAQQSDWVDRNEMKENLPDTKGYSEALGAPSRPPLDPDCLESLGFVTRPYQYKITKAGRQALKKISKPAT